MPLNLATLTDTELDQLRVDVAAERERRDRLAQAPAQVAEIARRYTEDGGNPAGLTAAITAS